MVSHHRSRSLRRQASLLHPFFRRAPREGTAGLRNPASRDPVRERGDQVFGECTRATAGSNDFANDDFFPDLGNLILDDMGNNVNAGGAAPAALYVILSFLFKIVVEFMFLVCVLDVIYSSVMLVCMISSISATVVMIYLLFIRIKSRSNLLIFPTIKKTELQHVRPFIALYDRENSRRCKNCKIPTWHGALR